MPETLLAPSGIKIYGRVMVDLQLAPPPGPPPPPPPHAPSPGGLLQPPPAGGNVLLGANQFLNGQLIAAGATLARIYGFSFEGHYYDLPKPAIFLVHGQGVRVNLGAAGRTDLDTSGVAAREWEFASSGGGAGPPAIADLLYWEYDKGDFSLRLDIETGPFEQILLAATLRGGPSFSRGAELASGAEMRSGAEMASGAEMRSGVRRRVLGT